MRKRRLRRKEEEEYLVGDILGEGIRDIGVLHKYKVVRSDPREKLPTLQERPLTGREQRLGGGVSTPREAASMASKMAFWKRFSLSLR